MTERERDEPRVAAWERISEWPMVVLAVAFLAAYATDVLWVGAGAGGRQMLRGAAYSIWVLFAVDYFVRLVLADDHRRYWWRHLADLAIIVLPILRPLRVLRLVMLLRVLNRHAATSLRGRVVMYGATSAVLLVFCAALACLDAERHHAGSNITSFGDAMWWASVTICTVGYGDRFPITTEGRFVGVGLMVSGVALVGAVTASFATWMIDRLRDEEMDDKVATRRDLLLVEGKLDGMERNLELIDLRLADIAAQRDGRATSASS